MLLWWPFSFPSFSIHSPQSNVALWNWCYLCQQISLKSQFQLPLPRKTFMGQICKPCHPSCLLRHLHRVWNRVFIQIVVCVILYMCFLLYMCLLLKLLILFGKCSKSVIVISAKVLSAASHFPKQLLHSLTRKLWKISLHQNILMLPRNFIPLYRGSDTCNKLNKNMFPF